MKPFDSLRWLLILGILSGAALAWGAQNVRAASVPQKLIYNGHLLDANGSAVATPQTIRFSLWSSVDLLSGEVTSTGAIHTASPNYVGWKDAFTVTPDARGYFSVELGSSVPLPDFGTLPAATLMSLFLQVEVKPDASPATSYEILDSNGADTAIDRSALLSVPFALNADLLDQRHVGTESGSIPVLLSGGLLDVDQVPGGTNRNAFTIDSDNSVVEGNITLEFGAALDRTLTYDVTNGRFRFNDDLLVDGNLTVTGLINGVDLSQITSSSDNSHLKVASGAGLTITVARGDYRLGGVVTQYPGATGIAVTDNATNYVFFSSGGLKLSTSGFPTDSAIIPVGTVVSAGGAITSVADRRVFNANDSQRSIVKVYEPMYEGAAYMGDGSSNVGQLSVSHSGATLKNFYQWTSTRSTLQDYAILLRVPLSADFVRWGTVYPLSLLYRTSSNDAASNVLGLSVFDSAGAEVALTGSGTTGLQSADWVNASWGFGGNPTWTAGGEMLIKVTLAAKDDASVQIGPLTIRTSELLSE